jgi:oligopeptide transport system permease protein
MTAVNASMEPEPWVEAPRPERGLLADAWRDFRRNRAAVAGAAILAVIVLSAVLGPIASPYRFDDQELAAQLEPPSFKHPFGTDIAGRDLLTRVLYGGRVSLLVGMVGTLVSLVIGVTWGATAGYVGGRIDNLMMRFVDLLYSLPFMFFVILLVTYFGRSLLLLFVALGAVQWLTMSRIVRGQILTLKTQPFVEAARALGVRNRRIVLHHLIPNLLGPVIVYATLTVPVIMLEEAFLSFLGLGVSPPATSWGLLAAEGATAISIVRTNWWLIVFPGAALSITLFCLNFLGDGLRDALDPRHARRR